MAKLVCALLAFLGAVSTLEAQVSVQEVANSGDAVPVKVDDPSNRGRTVRVMVTDGAGHRRELLVTLDEDGQGSSTWEVPAGWRKADFLLSDFPASTMMIQ